MLPSVTVFDYSGYNNSAKYTPLAVREKQLESVTVLTPTGEVSESRGLRDLGEGINRAFSSGKGVVINLAEAPNIDNMTLGSLITAHLKFGGAQEKGPGAMSVTNVNPHVAKKLQFTKLDRVLNIWSNEHTAVANTPARVQSAPTPPPSLMATAVRQQPHA